MARIKVAVAANLEGKTNGTHCSHFQQAKFVSAKEVNVVRAQESERRRTACLSIVGDPGPGDLALFIPVPIPVLAVC